MKRRLLSIAVTLAMCLSLLPAPALATQADSGTIGQEETFAFVPGVVPEPVQLVYPTLPGATLADFDALYHSPYVTSVKNQLQLGLCWTFGSLGAVEANLKMNSGNEVDLSEAHMAYSTSMYALASEGAAQATNCNPYGFDREISDGGHRYHAASYLMRNILQAGAVNEASDSYPATVEDPTNMPYRTVAATEAKGENKSYTVQNILFLTGDKTEVNSASDTSIIKQAIMNYGAVAASMYYDGDAVSGMAGAAFNDETNAYYYSGSELTSSGVSDTNHMVLIVGWDDAYAVDNFNTPPAGPGAWLVKNSWGPDWGDNGYFWVSYYDTNFPCNAFAVDGVDEYNSGLTVWEDDYGMTLGYANCDSSKLSNYYAEVYQRSELVSEKVTAVKVFVPVVTAGVDVTVAVDTSALTEEAKTTSSIFTTLDTTTKTIFYPGWYTIQLEEPVSLTEATNAFTVYVKLEDLNTEVDTHAVSIGVDYSDTTGSVVKTTPINSNYTLAYYTNGTEAYFMPMDSRNLCIKAVTTPTAQATVTTAPTAADDLMYDGTAKDLLATAGVAENGTMVYSLTEDGEYLETIPTATNAGSYTVYYKAKSNSQFGTDSEIGSVTVAIDQKPLTVTAKNVEILVDDEVPAASNLEYTSEGLVEGHTITAQLDYVGVSDPLPVGDYAIEVKKVTITDNLGQDVTSNYQITSTSGKLTVTAHTHEWAVTPDDGTLLATCVSGCSYPDGLTIQLSAEDTTYTGSEVTAQVKIMNVDEEVSSISLEELGLKLTYNATAVNVGNYTATLAVEEDPSIFISVPFAITAQTLVDNITIALNDTSFIYTGEAIEPAATVTLRNGTVLTAGEHYNVTYEDNIDASSQAKVIITGNGNYTDSVEQTFTIQPKSLTDAMVALTTGSWSYTGSAITPAVTVTDGQTPLIEGTHYSVAYEDNVTAGTAAKVIVTGMNNYGSAVTKTFTIEKAVPSIGAVTVASPATVYTSTDPAAVELTYANEATIPGTIVLDDKTTAFIAGNNSRAWTFTPNDSTNYTGTTGTITISAQADDVQSINVTPPTKKTYTYGEGLDFSGIAVMATFASGQTSNVTSAVSYSVDGNAVVSGQVLDASNDPITVTVSYTSGESTVTGSFPITIAPATPVVTAPTAKTLTYDGSAQELISAGTTSGGTMEYSLDGSSYSTTIPTGTAATTYTVWYKVTGNGNYNDVAPQSLSVSIAKASLDMDDIGAVSVASPSTVYTFTDPATVELTYANKSTIPGTIVLDDTATAFTAGNNSRTWTFTPNDTNYKALTGTITISAVADTVQSISVTPPTKVTYTYGEGLDFSGATVMADFTSGQTSNVTSAVSYSVDGNAVVSGQVLDAGNDPVTVTVSYTSAGSTVTDTFTITIAPATPVVTAPIANTLNYNGSAQDLICAGATTGGTLYYAVTTGTSQPNDASYTTTVPTAKEIGTYYVWYKVVGNNNYNDVAADYVSVSIDMGNLSCSNALTKSVLYNNTQPQTVTAADFGIQVSGGTFSIGAGYQDGGILNTPYLVANDTVIFELNPGLSYSQSASAQIPLTYTVDNYNPVDLMLTITLADKAIPNVSAAAYSKVYDGTAVNPSDITITSDVPGSLALYTGQTITNVGTATYVLTFVPDDTNTYSSVSVNAVVTITKAPLTITADDVTFTSGTVDTPTLTYKVTGLVNGETLEDIGLTISCSTNASDYATVGTYTITVSGNTEPSNYTVTYLPGTLTISPIPVVNYVVTFDPNGGSVNVTSATTSNGKLTSLPTATRSGYTFNGWYTAATGGTKVTADTIFTANTTIYAQWTYNNSNLGGGDAFDGSSSGSGSGSNSGSTSNADGSTTTTTTNKDGSVTQETTYKDGSKSEITVNKDGSAEFEAKMSDGSTATATIDADGKVEAKVELSDKATLEAAKNDEVVPLPIPSVPVTDDRNEASVITVSASDTYETKVEIPVENVTAGTVVILVDKDGKETIVTKSSVTEDGVVFAAQGDVTVKVVDNSKSFDDVKPNFWGNNSVAFVTSRELFSGTSNDTFSPNESMTRAMIFTVLARLDGQDPTGGANWWDKGTAWAKSVGLTDGSNPHSQLTREQLAVMLYNYSGKPAVDTSKLDKTGVSNWAENAMAWCVQQGVMAGDQNGNLNAGSNATRAEVATMLMSFVSSNNR